MTEYRSVYVFPKTVIYGCMSQLNAFNASTKKLACTTRIVWYNSGNIFYNTEGKEITYWIFADQVLGCCIDAVLLHNLVDTTLHSYTDKIKQIKETLTWKQASGSLLWETKHELKFKVMTVSCYSNKACRIFSRVWCDKNKQRKTINTSLHSYTDKNKGIKCRQN